ncbi:TPA: hypothetical protein DDW35_01240 [Candidatus Sumerlaeota bacterium]|jgi:flagellum-specific peptidoglycan hydrolase FlgJ|nr:hypothetical protein [Candidatus Sumerlaeota bacterium]
MSPLTPQQTDFRNRVTALAQRIAPRYRIPWFLMAATAILESGWNESAPSKQLNNFFNLRSTRTGHFRKFRCMAESFHAFGKAFISLPTDPEYLSTLIQIIPLLAQRSSHAQRSR